VTLVLLDLDGSALGALPPLDVPSPWWQQVGDVVRAARDAYGVELYVLRLLGVVKGAAADDVTYLAQLAQPCPSPLPLRPAEVDLSDNPRRASYARPHGPATTLVWARSVLNALGCGPLLAAEQLRTWNLSAIWRLSTRDSPLWIKQVPYFFGYEKQVLRWLAAHGPSFPQLLAADQDRMLLADIPGEDLYGAPVEVRATIARALHPAQYASVSDVDGLRALGVPDGGAEALLAMVREVLAPVPGDPVLDRLAAQLPRRLAEVAACGLPDALCHGDLHPGNARAAGDGPPVIIDWTDAFIGNPAFDVLRLTSGLPPAQAQVVLDDWAQRWRADVPGCDPHRAAELLRPVAALRFGAVYVKFLAHIEPDEHVYHADDPELCRQEAREIAAAEPTDSF
jgi:hypothetical protein